MPVFLFALLVIVAWSARESLVDAFADPVSDPQDTYPTQLDRSPAQDDRRARELVGLISADDYPSAAINRNEQGTVVARLSIDTTGRVTHCEVASSSGSSILDRTTCRILGERARFAPARDADGQPVGQEHVQSITWRLED